MEEKAILKNNPDGKLLIRKKRLAAQEFVRRLLASTVGGSVVKALLYGSVQKGQPHEESDIDLLIVLNGDVRQAHEICGDISFELLLETGERVEAIAYCTDNLFHPQSFFVYHILKTGEVLYTMEEQQVRQQEATALCHLAEDYLIASKATAQQGYVRLAIDGAYNAAELATKGLLRLRIDDMPSSHGGVVNRFGDLYVRTGEVVADLGRRLNKSLALRNLARYDYHANPTTEDYHTVRELAQTLIDILRTRLTV